MSSDSFEITIIAAVAANGIIGGDNSLLWHLPEDLKRFKRLTSGHPIIMGRKTFESLPGMLPNRPHIIISRNGDYCVEGAEAVTSLEAAIEAAKAHGTGKGFIIGGGEIYRLALEVAHTLEITEVEANYDGDTSFPAIDTAIWHETAREAHSVDEKHKHAYNFVSYKKARA